MSLVVKSRKSPSTAVIVAPAQQKRQRPRRKKTKQNVQMVMSRPGNSGVRNTLISDYARTLSNPWEYGPIRLGYDCMVSTALGTAYRRDSFTCAADGSFTITLLPTLRAINGIDGPIYLGYSGKNSPASGSKPFSNQTSLTTQFATARVVSGGIRVIVLVPGTSPNGVLVAGYAAETNGTTAAAQTAVSLFADSTGVLGFGAAGAAATVRPLDNESYQFTSLVIKPDSESVLMHSASPWIAGQGFPPGATVWYEAVLNIEGPPNSTQYAVQGREQSISASDIFPTPQTLFNAVKNIVSEPAVMDFAQSAADVVHPVLGRVVHAARNFGHGQHVRSVQQSRLVIEEIGDPADPGRDEL